MTNQKEGNLQSQLKKISAKEAMQTLYSYGDVIFTPDFNENSESGWKGYRLSGTEHLNGNAPTTLYSTTTDHPSTQKLNFETTREDPNIIFEGRLWYLQSTKLDK